MKKVIISGASGLLGSKIVESAEGKYVVCPTHATRSFFSNSLKMDITDESEVKHVFNKVKPDIVVHTAAVTNVDRCETDKSYALKVNAEGTKILAEACNEAGAKIVYVSTDYVFDGEKGLYTEEDETNPVNYYGLTKLMGEKHVARICDSFLILRPSVLYGVHPWKPNFVKWVINALKERRTINVVEDHYNSPTFADNLAEVILEMIDKELKGLYHISGVERISRYRFALKIAKVFNFYASLIKPVRMSELEVWTARRPEDSSLCVEKVKKEIDTELFAVTHGLREMSKSE